jgi:hypothetical protein
VAGNTNGIILAGIHNPRTISGIHISESRGKENVRPMPMCIAQADRRPLIIIIIDGAFRHTAHLSPFSTVSVTRYACGGEWDGAQRTAPPVVPARAHRVRQSVTSRVHAANHETNRQLTATPHKGAQENPRRAAAGNQHHHQPPTTTASSSIAATPPATATVIFSSSQIYMCAHLSP